MSVTNEASTEAAILAAGKTAQRITPADIDVQIAGIQFHRFPGTTLIICALTLQNTFIVTGESRPASDENFDENIGKDIAFKNAREKIWAFEGYALRNRLAGRS